MEFEIECLDCEVKLNTGNLIHMLETYVRGIVKVDYIIITYQLIKRFVSRMMITSKFCCKILLRMFQTPKKDLTDS